MELEILLLPFFGQGHLFPFFELIKHLSGTNTLTITDTSLSFTTTLLIPSSLSTSIPSSLRQLDHHRVQIAEIPSSASPFDPPPGPGPMGGPHHDDLLQGIESLLSARPGSARPVCVVIDVMMSWAKPVFDKFGVPVAVLFTSGACSAAVEFGSWKAHVTDLKPGESRVIPGLPEDMAFSYSDLMRAAHHHPPPPHGGPPPSGLRPGGPPGPGLKGPPGPGRRPPWVDDVEGTVAIMINTCRELEGPFLDYLANQLGKPVWGVGPLLPEEYWKATGSVVQDHEIRAEKQSNYNEQEVIQWLDSKPRGSVLYISFGTEVGPTVDENAELASALEELDQPFIWVIRPGSHRPGLPPPQAGARPGSPPHQDEYYPHGLDKKVGERGLIIRGWAPQLLILSHPSTGGFVSHCGWNSIVEALGRAVPVLAWPIRGDQHHNAKLVVCHLKVGYMAKEECSSTSSPERIKKDDVVRGIKKLMSDAGVKERANELRAKFVGGLPASSMVALEAFRNFALRTDDKLA